MSAREGLIAMPKMKPHKGLLKRVRLTKTGLAKHNKAGCKHLRSSKSPDRLRTLRAGSYVPTTYVKHASRMLGVRVRGEGQPISAIKRNPSPEERKAAQAEKKRLRAEAQG